MCSANPSAQPGASRSWKLRVDASGEGVSWRMRAEAEIRCPGTTDSLDRPLLTGDWARGRRGWVGGAQPPSLPPASCQGLPAPTSCDAPECAQRMADVSWGGVAAETGEGAAGCSTRRSAPETAETPRLAGVWGGRFRWALKERRLRAPPPGAARLETCSSSPAELRRPGHQAGTGVARVTQAAALGQGRQRADLGVPAQRAHQTALHSRETLEGQQPLSVPGFAPAPRRAALSEQRLRAGTPPRRPRPTAASLPADTPVPGGLYTAASWSFLVLGFHASAQPTPGKMPDPRGARGLLLRPHLRRGPAGDPPAMMTAGCRCPSSPGAAQKAGP